MSATEALAAFLADRRVPCAHGAHTHRVVTAAFHGTYAVTAEDEPALCRLVAAAMAEGGWLIAAVPRDETPAIRARLGQWLRAGPYEPATDAQCGAGAEQAAAAGMVGSPHGGAGGASTCACASSDSSGSEEEDECGHPSWGGACGGSGAAEAAAGEDGGARPPAARVPTALLHREFMATLPEYAVQPQLLSEIMRAWGFPVVRSHGVRYYAGLRRRRGG